MKLLLVLVLLMAGCAKPKDGVDGAAGPQGAQGQRGIAGADAQIEVITPCPTIIAQYPEVLWKTGGKLYAVYASGAKIHLVELTDGSYTTTDGRNCNFMVSNGDIL